MPIDNISTNDLIKANEVLNEGLKEWNNPHFKKKGFFQKFFEKGPSLNDTTKSEKSHSVKQEDNIQNKSESSISKFFDDLKADIKQIAQDFKTETKKLGNFFRAVGIALEKLNDSLDKAEDKKDVKLAFRKFTIDYKLARGLLNLGDRGKAAYKDFSKGNYKNAIDKLDVDTEECKELIKNLRDAIGVYAQGARHDFIKGLKNIFDS